MSIEDGVSAHVQQLRRRHRRAIRYHRALVVMLAIVLVVSAIVGGGAWLQMRDLQQQIISETGASRQRLARAEARNIDLEQQVASLNRDFAEERRQRTRLSPVMGFSPDGSMAVARSGWLFSTNDGTTLRHVADPVSVRFDPGGGIVAIATKDHDVHIIDRDGAPVAHLPALEGEIAFLGFAQYRPEVIAATRAGEVVSFNLRSGHVTLANVGFVPTFVAPSPDGRLFVAGQSDGGVSLHDTATGHLTRRWMPPRGASPAVTGAISTDGRQVLLTAGDATVRVLDSGSGAQIARFDRVAR
jgi:cell division protein FtsB